MNTSVINDQEFRFVMIFWTTSLGPQVKTGNGNFIKYVHQWTVFTTNSVACLMCSAPLCTVTKLNSRPTFLHILCLK
jgi:hypothetical protein